MHKPWYTDRRSRNSSLYSPSGDKYKDTVQLSKDERGNFKVIVTGRIDISEQIQTFKDGCDIHKIVARYNVTGDPLPINPEAFGGVSPSVISLRDMNASLAKARQLYEKVPQSVAKKYPTFESFLDVFGDKTRLNEVYELMGVKVRDKTEIPSETISNASQNVKAGDINA